MIIPFHCHPLFLNCGLFLSDDDDQQLKFTWFSEASRQSCAIFAVLVLYHALNRGTMSSTDTVTKHQMYLLDHTPLIISSAAFWLSRHGPRSLLSASMSLLSALVKGNESVGTYLSNLNVKIVAPVKGKTVPVDWDEHAQGQFFLKEKV